MTAVGAVSVSVSFAAPLPRPPGVTGSAEASALPAPTPTIVSSSGDAMAMIYTALNQANSEQFRAGQTEVTVDKTMQKQQEQAEESALAAEQRAEGQGSKGLFKSVTGLVKDMGKDIGTGHFARAVRDTEADVSAAYHSPRFWHDVEIGARYIAQGAAIAATVAASVATCGAAAPTAVLVTALVLSSAGAAEEDFHVLEKCGVNTKVAGMVGLGMSLGGAAAGAVGSLALSPTAVSAFVQAMKAAGAATQVVAGSCQVASSVAGGRVEAFQAEAEDDEADATQADDRMQAINHTTSMILDAVGDANDSLTRAMQSLQGAMQTRAHTMVVASGRMA